MIGAIIGWFFLGLLCLLVVLLVVPAGVGIRLEEGTWTIWVQVLFVKYQLLPAKPKKEKKAKKSKKEKKKEKPVEEQETEEKEEKEEKKKTLEQQLVLVRRVAKSASATLKRILKGLRIKNVTLFLPVYGQDAAATAIRCGEIQALIGSTHAVLTNLLHISYSEMVILPDFSGQWESRLHFSCKIVASPVIILAAGIVGLWQFVFFKKTSYTRKEYYEYQKQKRAQQQAEKQESQKLK